MRLFVDCTPLSEGGGVQVALAFLSHLAADNGIDWCCIAPKAMEPRIADIPDGLVKTHFLPKSGLFDIVRASFVLREFEQTFSPDVVFTVFGPAYFRARAPHVVGFALPNLVYDRPPHLRPFVPGLDLPAGVLRRYLLSWADHFIVETPVVAALMTKRLQVAQKRISVVANALNPALATKPATKSVWAPPYIILIPSAYYPHKNLEIIPHVAARLRHIAPGLAFEFRLTIPRGHPAWGAIAQSAAALKVAAEVSTLGALDFEGLSAAYSASHMVLLPTLREVSTAVYPESFHFQRPLITSNEAFAVDLCGEAALYAPPMDADAISRMVLRVINEPTVRDKLITEGATRLRTCYPTPVEKYAQQIVILRNVARSKLGSRYAPGTMDRDGGSGGE